jgi:hypothetical protein
MGGFWGSSFLVGAAAAGLVGSAGVGIVVDAVGCLMGWWLG